MEGFNDKTYGFRSRDYLRWFNNAKRTLRKYGWKKLKETLCGDIQNYLNTIEKLYSTFNILAYDSGSVYIDRE